MHHVDPVEAAFAEPGPDESSPVRSSAVAGPRILVVEDDPAFCELVAWSLEEQGYDVTRAAGLAEARAACGEVGPSGPFDLIVSDIIMPHGSGTDLLFAQEIVSQGTPVILMTAFASPELRDFVRECGSELLEKPFAIEELVAKVLERLRERFLQISELVPVPTGGS